MPNFLGFIQTVEKDSHNRASMVRLRVCVRQECILWGGGDMWLYSFFISALDRGE